MSGCMKTYKTRILQEKNKKIKKRGDDLML